MSTTRTSRPRRTTFDPNLGRPTGRISDPPWIRHRDDMRHEYEIARGHARQVKQFEKDGRLGAWRLWQDWVDQWPVDSSQRAALVEIFGITLDQLDEEELGHSSLYVNDIW